MADDDKPIDRRRFFRAGLAELLKPLSKAIRPLEAMANELGKLERPMPAPEIRRAQNTVPNGPTSQSLPIIDHEHWVRPPGARPEQEFLELCSRCGECVRVCPVRAIIIDETQRSGKGAPYIDIQTQPCVMCETLDCLYHCPTGAILAVPRENIDIGVASWIDYQCLNNQGTSCSICVDQCPVGKTAIELVGNRIDVHEDGCTGCGVCEHACPTYPKSITITPKSERDAPPVEYNSD